MATVASPAGKPDVDPIDLRPLELAVDIAAVNATLPEENTPNPSNISIPYDGHNVTVLGPVPMVFAPILPGSPLAPMRTASRTDERDTRLQILQGEIGCIRDPTLTAGRTCWRSQTATSERVGSTSSSSTSDRLVLLVNRALSRIHVVTMSMNAAGSIRSRCAGLTPPKPALVSGLPVGSGAKRRWSSSVR